MTPKQEAFVREFCVDRNATQAAIRAGYSEKTAYSIGEENLKKPEIAAAIQMQGIEHAKRCDVTVDQLTDELEQARLDAMKNGQPNAAVQAIMGKAKLHGLVIDKTKNENINRSADVSDEILTPEEWAQKYKPRLS